ncbi:MAG: hypothetical protein V4706_01780 [Pseudomonadota bacterium]
MAAITIVIADTPKGGISIRSDFVPAVGNPCTVAQSAALDIISRTRKDYGLGDQVAKAPAELPPAARIKEVDIDAVHRSRDRVVQAAS